MQTFNQIVKELNKPAPDPENNFNLVSEEVKIKSIFFDPLQRKLVNHSEMLYNKNLIGKAIRDSDMQSILTKFSRHKMESEKGRAPFEKKTEMKN